MLTIRPNHKIISRRPSSVRVRSLSPNLAKMVRHGHFSQKHLEERSIKVLDHHRKKIIKLLNAITKNIKNKKEINESYICNSVILPISTKIKKINLKTDAKDLSPLAQKIRERHFRPLSQDENLLFADLRHKVNNSYGLLQLFAIELGELTRTKAKTKQEIVKMLQKLSNETFTDIKSKLSGYRKFLKKGLGKGGDLSSALIAGKKSVHSIAAKKHIKIIVKGNDLISKVNLDPKVKNYHIYSIAENLLGNAVKYSPKHGEIHVRFELGENEKKAAVLKFFIKDSGIGIPKEDINDIFTGQRASNALSSNISGTGYGLSRVNQLMKDVGGKIWVNSTSTVAPTGTEFAGYIPIIK